VNHSNNRSIKPAILKNKSLLFHILTGCLLLQLTACTSYKNTPYFQNISSDTASVVYKNGEKIKVASYEDLKIQSNDILNISIQTIDPELNASLLTGDPNNNLRSNFIKTGNNNEIPGYLVDNNGMIEIPLAGIVKVAGLTTSEAKDKIRVQASQFYKEPVVNVRIANFKVSILGEVLKPGSYLINGEKATLLDALSEAGDLTIFGKRDNVLLSRKEDGKQKIVRFNLTSTDIYDSPYFYLKQGDVIYVQPSKSKAASTDGAAVRTYALISSTLSLVVVLATRTY
jgi:polysaccharide export outer membrane protein